MNNQSEIPSLAFEIHCVWTCFATVSSSTMELTQPIASATQSRMPTGLWDVQFTVTAIVKVRPRIGR